MTEAVASAVRRNLIDGAWDPVASSRTMPINEPARPRNVLWEAVQSGQSDVERAVSAARRASEMWRRSPGERRADVLLAASAHLTTRLEAVVTDLALEQGKTLGEARREVTAAVRSLQYFAGQAMAAIGDVLPKSAHAERVWAERVPLGPIACITPWNFPLLIPTYKVAAAIAYGNTVVLKPASLTPGAATRLMEALVAAELPDGVVNMCLGDGAELSDALVGNPDVRGISFTGSTAVGRSLKTRTADSLVRTQLEMGGKNPLLVLDDANLETAAMVAVTSAMGMAGQRCTAVSRAIVQRPVAARFCESVVAKVGALRVGHPLEPGVDMGPVISATQRSRVLAAVDRAEADGARVVIRRDEAVPDEGHFVPPIVIDRVEPEMSIAREEVFGPVLAVLVVDSVDDAIALANDSPYGLTASVCTQDLDRAMRLVDELDVGIIHINRPTPDVERYGPFGGVKWSGFGAREQGVAAREFFTEWKTVYVSSG